MKVLQINTTHNSGSTGRIAESIGQSLISLGHKSNIAFGRNGKASESNHFRIGNDWDIRYHGLKSRLLDLHGFGSTQATKKFVEQIDVINPDLIHIHNLHGYYLNVEVLFNFLKEWGIPVIWTLHDCWPFTGHCSYFDRYNCEKWKTGCYNCPNRRGYPESWLIDNSKNNYNNKRDLFTSLENLVIVTPSIWLANHVANSFLKNYQVRVINNGVDMNIFQPGNIEEVNKKYHLADKKIVLGVASTWDKRKGFNDFVQLRSILDYSCEIVLVGLNRNQILHLPDGITGISRTENIHELATLYSSADVFANPTYVDNFPTTNLEALACGTPVITYNTGGSVEAIDESTGLVVEKGDLSGLANAIKTIIQKGKDSYSAACRERAEQLFDKNARFGDYITLYQSLIEKQSF